MRMVARKACEETLKQAYAAASQPPVHELFLPRCTSMHDVHTPLASIAQTLNASIISQLIQIQKLRREKVKSAHWAKNLEVVSFPTARADVAKWEPYDGALIRGRICSEDYLALSYVWRRSEHEDPVSHSVYVESRDDIKVLKRSQVRDSVWNRVYAYMEHKDIPYVWIDQESINQGNSGEKQIAMQSMDLVYKKAQHSLALLTVAIKSQEELDLLADLLSGEAVVQKRKRKRDTQVGLYMADTVDPSLASKVIDLLLKLTSDPWWRRAWCFQEEYLAQRDMQLLIPYRAGLEKSHHSKYLGRMLENELVIDSSLFRRRLTKFCIAYANSTQSIPLEPRTENIREIIARAPRYTTLADFGLTVGYDMSGRTMSSQILKDIASRNLQDPFDIINIAANCCRYSMTLDTDELRKQNHELSLSLLALYLMNGEVFRNDINAPDLGTTKDVFQYLHSMSFDRFDPPVPYGELSYMKRYRFVNPEICEHGLEASGLLWRIDEMVPGMSTLRSRQDAQDSEDDEVELYALYYLLSMVEEDHPELEWRLRNFLKQGFSASQHHGERGGTPMMSLMASELARAVLEGEWIGVGHMVPNESVTFAKEGVQLGFFILPRIVTKSRPLYAFVSWQPGEELEKTYERQPDADKFLSLEVELHAGEDGQAQAQLITKDWIHCLPFFKGEKLKRYLFPWPASLRQA